LEPYEIILSLYFISYNEAEFEMLNVHSSIKSKVFMKQSLCLFSFLCFFQLSLLGSSVLGQDNPPLPIKKIVVFGDSLSAGYGLDQGEDWPSLLEARLASEKRGYQMINLSISGETTQGGSLRLAKAMDRIKPDIVIIALGANDGLRGQSIKKMKANIVNMVQIVKQHRAKVLLVGMKIPPNYGKRYATQFENTFAQVASQENVPLLPFLLDGVAQDSSLFQKDQLHPLAKAQPIVMNLVYRYLEPLLVKK
jgi:acyl-CoA thioesterase-1